MKFVATNTELTTIVYYDTGKGTDGILTALPKRLANIIEFDTLSLEEQPASKRITLWFRHGAKCVFRIRFVRKSGHYLVKMGGLDAERVLDGIQVCKQHFDQWFDISKRDITSYEDPLEPGSNTASVGESV